MMAFIILVFSVSALASDKDPADCTNCFDIPDPYHDCFEKNTPPVNISIPKTPSEKTYDKSCSSCDARQRKQVEKRLKEKKSEGEKNE
jgi:hypothetical protein